MNSAAEVLTKANVSLTARGRLRNGNPSGDFTTAPRCGARTRRGLGCQAPAIHGRKRCRLHGGLSTGPRTAEGRARVRAAVTRHGRYSRETIALEQAIREHRQDLQEAALASRSKWQRMVLAEAAVAPIPPSKVEELRTRIRLELWGPTPCAAASV